LGQRDTRLAEAGWILIELSTGMKRFGSENCSGFDFRGLIIVKKLTLCNVVTGESENVAILSINVRRIMRIM
jgi:hypothetical protein